MAAPPLVRHPGGATARPAGARPASSAPRLVAVPDAPPRASRVHPAVYAVLAALIVALGTFGSVSLNALSAEASFQARALETEIARLQLERDDLVAEVAALETPSRVRDAAVSDLGLMAPERPGFLRIDPRAVYGSDPKLPARLGE